MSEFPQEPTPVTGRSRIDESRRKRRQRLLVPSGKSERAIYLNEIAKRLVPGVEYFAFSLVAGLVIAAGILLDSPALLILGALLAPFMAPAVGLGFSTVIGSLSFFLRSTAALLIGALLVFGSGALAGWISRLFVEVPLSEAQRFTTFTVPDFLLLTVGAVLAIYLTIRVPKQRSLVASVPLSYEIYVPVAVAGFGLTSSYADFFPSALWTALINVAWVILVGTITLAVLKMRPFKLFGYALTAAIIGSALYGLYVTSALGSAVQQQMEPFVTRTPKVESTVAAANPTRTLPVATPEFTATPSVTPKLTNTLAPSQTPTLTITPKPTPVWAKVYSATYSGVLVRKTPGFDGEYLTSVDNGSLIQVLPEVELVDGVYWAHVMLEDGRVGWMVRSLLLTATPVPGW
jgi:uncharacterized membrane protein